MFLSNLTHPPGWNRDTQMVHRTLAYHFDGESFLWAAPTATTTIVQGSQPVDPTKIDKMVTSYTAPAPMITAARVSFAIIGNPVRQDAKSRKRVLLPPERWEEWITRKFDGALKIEHLNFEWQKKRNGKRHEMTVTHELVAFNGIATVTNHEALAHLQRTGVGRGKAYGAGLLLLKGIT